MSLFALFALVFICFGITSPLSIRSIYSGVVFSFRFTKAYFLRAIVVIIIIITTTAITNTRTVTTITAEVIGFTINVVINRVFLFR